MESHAEDDSPGWTGKFNFEKIGRRRAALSAPARKSKPKPEPEDEPEEVRLTAKQLMRRRFERPRQIVEGLFPAGCLLLVGPPKQGKSWLSLQLARCVEAGIPFMGHRTEQGDVLYLALEDGFIRLQDRLGKQEIEGAESFTDALDFQIQIPTAEKGGLKELEEWLIAHPDASLVIVDVLKMFREPRKGKVDPYERDYGDVRPLTKLANQYRVCIVIVHHTNKGSASAVDPFDRVSGTGGISGAADGTILLVPNEDGDLGLYGRGRDFQEFDFRVRFDADACVWEMDTESDDSDRHGYGDVTGKILEQLRFMNGNAIGPSELAAVIHEKPLDVSKSLKRLSASRKVTRIGRGKWVLRGLEPKSA